MLDILQTLTMAGLAFLVAFQHWRINLLSRCVVLLKNQADEDRFIARMRRMPATYEAQLREAEHGYDIN